MPYIRDEWASWRYVYLYDVGVSTGLGDAYEHYNRFGEVNEYNIYTQRIGCEKGKNVYYILLMTCREVHF
jgi:hypothetical protein